VFERETQQEKEREIEGRVRGKRERAREWKGREREGEWKGRES